MSGGANLARVPGQRVRGGTQRVAIYIYSLAWHQGIKDKRIWQTSASRLRYFLAHILRPHSGSGAKEAANRSIADSKPFICQEVRPEKWWREWDSNSAVY